MQTALEQSVGEDVRRTSDAWAAAMTSNDAERIGGFMTSDWVIVGPSGVTSRNAFLALVASGDLMHDVFEATLTDVRVWGDAAVAIGRTVNSGRFRGTEFTADEWTTDMFIRQDGRWRCTASQVAPSRTLPPSAPPHYAPIMSYVVVPDADAFAAFLQTVFGARTILRMDAEDGSVRHAEYGVNGGTIMFGQAGGPWKPFPCAMYLPVTEVRGLHAKGLAAGATSTQEPEDRGYGLAAGFVDPWGNQWWLNEPPPS